MSEIAEGTRVQVTWLWDTETGAEVDRTPISGTVISKSDLDALLNNDEAVASEVDEIVLGVLFDPGSDMVPALAIGFSRLTGDIYSMGPLYGGYWGVCLIQEPRTGVFILQSFDQIIG